MNCSCGIAKTAPLNYSSIVSYPDPPISAALGVLHHQHAERKGLETLARFSCALEEFAQSQWGARCHVTDRTHVRNV